MRESYRIVDGVWTLIAKDGVYFGTQRQRVQSDFPLPQIVRPLPEMVSPIDGEVITDRAQRREHMKKHGVVEAGDRKPMGYKNPSFALKRGLKLNEG